jgi:pheromone shutdown-related protein TraB
LDGILKNNLKEIKRISNDVHLVTFEDGKELHLIGTAHVSSGSVKLVEETINQTRPDTVAVELDSNRLDAVKNKKKYQETDIIQIIKSKKVFFFIAQLLLSSFQKRIAKKFGVKPGGEFIKAIDLAEKTDANIVLADRNIAITLKRILRKLSFFCKVKLFISFMFTGKEEKNIEEKNIEEIKSAKNLNTLIEEMGKVLPVVKTVLLDERNRYLAKKIRENLGEQTVAVVGAAHVPGILDCLEKGDDLISSFAELEAIPPKSRMSKIIPWIFPFIIAAIFVSGFFYGDYGKIEHAAIYWVLVNGILTSVGCLLALGHPVTIVLGFFAAPVTSLNPTIGAGMVVGLVQLFLVRPKVKDFENVTDDITDIKRILKNKLTRALLVSVFASIGSTIGTFAALPFILKIIT